MNKPRRDRIPSHPPEQARLLDIAKFPHELLSESEIVELDAFVRAGVEEVQAKWNPKDEFRARTGKAAPQNSTRFKMDFAEHDARLFERVSPIGHTKLFDSERFSDE